MKPQRQAGALGPRMFRLQRLLLLWVSSLAISDEVLGGFLGCKTSKPAPPADPGVGIQLYLGAFTWRVACAGATLPTRTPSPEVSPESNL